MLEKSLKVWFMQLFKCLNPALKIGFMEELIHMLFKHYLKNLGIFYLKCHYPGLSIGLPDIRVL